MTTIIKNSVLTAEIKNFGAELISLKTNLNKEYIWEGNLEFWGKHSPILFPIVGTLKDNSFHHNGMEYHLSRHGFARDMEFELINASDNSATFSIQSSDETLKVYPFEFELQLIYTLDKNNLFIAYKVINKGKSTMPFAIGAHPAFALPNQFENYAIAFEKEEKLEYYLLEDDLISNNTKQLEVHNKQIPLTYELFKNDALIFKTLQSDSLTILENENPILRVHFKDFPSLGIWTKMNAPFLCIEPWFGYSDTNENSGNLLEKEAIQILESNEIFNSNFSIEIL
ncbi:aldose 1-epimerase family protein [Flavobacterium algoritolerans]|uniref:Aldose 1-epimerase family protein n=1 Tax=Flavobacterium algoritolerans TaxID=3041254 RepID=A0ABT6V8Z2_9FLAO|nr:aldose 1-epimerase family protein [Flavobacterium algoritolerans]MDI5894706.1 aldose 1-epimerase family protein [Flavobacterium algoritolerans]